MDAAGSLDDALEVLARADAKAADAVEPHRDSWAVEALSIASELGDQPQLRLLCAALIAGGLVTARPRLARAGFRMLLAHEATTIVKDLVKNRVDRTRPRSARSAADRKMRPGRNPAKEESSFPSGHSAGAIAVARAFSREYPEYVVPALGAAGLVAGAQVPRCAHYVTDVGAGLAIGAAVEAVVDAGWRHIESVVSPAEKLLIANGSQLP